MKLDIRPLTPDLLEDYLDFFGNVAFADHPEWSQCYCMHFHWAADMEAEFHRSGKRGYDYVTDFIKHGVIQGYLAYLDGKVVGWCNANDKKNYTALPERWEANEDEKVKSVVCFLVAPGMRGKGIASMMLTRVCVDAQAQGYDFIEGYPPAGACDMYIAHHGTVRLFEKFGFAVHAAFEHDAVMRKYLGG